MEVTMLCEKDIESIKSFAGLLNDVDGRWDNLLKAIDNIESEIQDLLHETELTTFNAYEGYLLAKKIQEARQRRRVLKNEQEIIQFVKDFASNNKNLFLTLFKLTKNMQNTANHQGKRKYTPRIRTDIKLAEGGTCYAKDKQA